MIGKKVKLTLLCVGTLVALVLIGFRVSKARTFQFFGELVPRVNTRQQAVALTFDDGPQPGPTEELLAILTEAGVKATFFVTGAELGQNLEQGRKIVAAGHELGNHSYSHTRMVLKTPAFIEEEVEKTDALIRRAGYQGAIHFRPPFGKKLFLLPYYLAKTARKSITWDVEPESYPEIDGDADKITAHVLGNTRPGSIILLHVMYPSRAASLKSVKGIIAGLHAQGYEFKTVSQLLSLAN